MPLMLLMLLMRPDSGCRSCWILALSDTLMLQVGVEEYCRSHVWILPYQITWNGVIQGYIPGGEVVWLDTERPIVLAGELVMWLGTE